MDQVRVKLNRIVVNEEEQYSIWPVDRELPRGWRAVPNEAEASRDQCLTRIAELWTDMRPASLRGQRWA